MSYKDDVKAYADSKKDLCVAVDTIPEELFRKFGVNRGLRDENGKGVLTGLTTISKVISFKSVDGVKTPCDGELWYRGYQVNNLIDDLGENEFGFEKTAYLLLFGELPSEAELMQFSNILGKCRRLPTNFTRDVIMKAPSKDIMNSMTRSILTLASYDGQTSDASVENSLRQCIQLIANFPLLAVYAYHAYNHYDNGDSMYIHRPDPSLSTAENFLKMLRPDQKYTQLEAKVLDVALMLHMEHGGGNNSTFTTRVVTSAGTDTYSAIAAAMSSLKGPKHGGANIKVVQMFDNIKKNVKDWKDDEEICLYITKILKKEVFDKSGLVYGIGHAVYSLSDPRAVIFKDFVKELAISKNATEEYELYSKIETLAPQIICEHRKVYKGVSANIDFYSGFVYRLLDLPIELYTPLFATARLCGWSAHRIEELSNNGKIIRPAYKSVSVEKKYEKMANRIS